MLGVESESTDEDPDFNDSDYNVYDDDDCLFDRNVTEGIEMGMHIVERVEGQEFDSSSYASSEELNFLSGSDSEGLSGKLNYPEYYVGSEKRNPQFEVGLLFATFEELKSAMLYIILELFRIVLETNVDVMGSATESGFLDLSSLAGHDKIPLEQCGFFLKN
ncbi:Hypothetical predicted protein [Olea europaea subsp. europaea]|uniref:Uncharacterized protein n=1 Tax=Olea europaea subsp. europaea TaxID=158383 RepID=A0A8S0PDT2_OLEEU|nr:Hypothetical predicted protein [Olea europaea subsp. europaea]